MIRPQLPDYGAYLRWPGSGHHWIHHDDVARVRGLIPSTRVFRREAFDGTFYRLRYGDQVIRLRPSLWLPVPYEGFDVGQPIETVGVGMVRDLFVARIVEMRFDRRQQQIRYHLQRGGQVLPETYAAEHLRSLEDRPALRSSWFESRRG